MPSKEETVYLGLGSNLGDRDAYLDLAVTLLARNIRLTRKSSFYDTAPEKNTEQPRFLNMVVQGLTAFPPMELLDFIKDVEKRMGRQPQTHNLPRVIDIDILLYGDCIMKSSRLTIPHLLLSERAFVLVPLLEIAPQGLQHPESHKSFKELLDNMGGNFDVVRWERK